LHRTGTVKEYQRPFLMLVCRCEGLSPDHLMNLFMAGLGEPMTYDVKMQKPTDLQSAMSLASLNSILSEIIKSCQIPLCKETSISFMQVASSKIIFRKST
jgi:hypothetical protein